MVPRPPKFGELPNKFGELPALGQPSRDPPPRPVPPLTITPQGEQAMQMDTPGDNDPDRNGITVEAPESLRHVRSLKLSSQEYDEQTNPNDDPVVWGRGRKAAGKQPEAREDANQHRIRAFWEGREDREPDGQDREGGREGDTPRVFPLAPVPEKPWIGPPRPSDDPIEPDEWQRPGLEGLGSWGHAQPDLDRDRSDAGREDAEIVPRPANPVVPNEEHGALQEPELETAEGEQANGDEPAERAAVEGGGVPAPVEQTADNVESAGTEPSKAESIDKAGEAELARTDPEEPHAVARLDAVDDESLGVTEPGPAEPATHAVERSALQAGEGGDVNGTETPPESLGDPEGWLDLADVLAESLENLFVKILMEGFAELADANAFPAGQIVRFAYKVSQPRLTVPIRAYGNDSVEVRLQAAITLDGPLLDLDVRRQGDQPAPTAPPDHQPQPNGHWPLKYFWIESHLPCAVAVLSRTTLRDLTGLPRLSAEGFAAQVERTETIATPYALGLIIPDARLAVLGLRPARRKRAGFTELVQLDRHTRTVNRWTVTG